MLIFHSSTRTCARITVTMSDTWYDRHQPKQTTPRPYVVRDRALALQIARRVLQIARMHAALAAFHARSLTRRDRVAWPE